MFISVIVLIVLIEPAYISSELQAVHVVFRIMKYVVTVAVLAVFIIRREKLDMLLLSAIIFEGCLLVSTLINGGDLYIWVRTCAYCIVLLLFMQMIVRVNPELLLKALSIVFGIYVHINTLTWILYPDGLYIDAFVGYKNCWFLGYDNCAGAIIILAEVVALYRIITSRKWFRPWELSILISGSVFVFALMIASAIVAEVTAILFLLLTRSKAIRALIGRARIVVIAMLCMFLLLHFLSVQERPIFSMIFLLLGKDTTFTGRTRVWKIGWKAILSKNFLMGFGIHEAEYYSALFNSRAFNQLHCYYLQILYDGGFLAFGSFVFMLMQAAKRFDSGQKNFGSMALLAGLVAYMILWQIEAYSSLLILFFVLLSLLYNPICSEGKAVR